MQQSRLLMKRYGFVAVVALAHAGAKAAGTYAWLTKWEGSGHVPYGVHRQEILDQTANFLYHSMDLLHAPQ